MKKVFFSALMIAISFTAFAQKKSTNKSFDQKWKFRFRALVVMPPSSS